MTVHVNLTSPNLAGIVTGIGACIVEALEQTPAGAPCRQCLLVPTSLIAWDNCGPCDTDGDCGAPGQVALAITSVYGSNSFPQPANGVTWSKCGPRFMVARAVASITRCLPALDQDGAPPDCDDLLAAAITLENDRTAALQGMACCLSDLASAFTIGAWLIEPAVTYPESGGCGGIEIPFSFAVTTCLCPG